MQNIKFIMFQLFKYAKVLNQIIHTKHDIIHLSLCIVISKELDKLQ